MHVFTLFVLFEGERFHGGGRVWYFKCHLTKIYSYFYFYCYSIYSIRINTRISKECVTITYIAVMIFCAQPYLKPCFMCPFYILSTCPSKGLCTALMPNVTVKLPHQMWRANMDAAMKPPGLLQGKFIFKKLPNGNCKQFITTSYVGLQFKIHV